LRRMPGSLVPRCRSPPRPRHSQHTRPQSLGRCHVRRLLRLPLYRSRLSRGPAGLVPQICRRVALAPAVHSVSAFLPECELGRMRGWSSSFRLRSRRTSTDAGDFGQAPRSSRARRAGRSSWFPLACHAGTGLQGCEPRRPRRARGAQPGRPERRRAADRGRWGQATYPSLPTCTLPTRQDASLRYFDGVSGGIALSRSGRSVASPGPVCRTPDIWLRQWLPAAREPWMAASASGD
jgi:hypothetical protein